MAYPTVSPMVVGQMQDIYAQRANQMQQGNPIGGISSLTMAPGSSGGGFMGNLQQAQQQLQAAYQQAQQIGNMQRQAGSLQHEVLAQMGSGTGQGGSPSGVLGGIGSIGGAPPFAGTTNQPPPPLAGTPNQPPPLSQNISPLRQNVGGATDNPFYVQKLNDLLGDAGATFFKRQ